jgi:hypothetical protein
MHDIFTICNLSWELTLAVFVRGEGKRKERKRGDSCLLSPSTHSIMKIKYETNNSDPLLAPLSLSAPFLRSLLSLSTLAEKEKKSGRETDR